MEISGQRSFSLREKLRCPEEVRSSVGRKSRLPSGRCERELAVFVLAAVE